MSPEQFRDLIAGGEGLDVEFKREDRDRKEATGLCRLSPDQTFRLLQRLTESGRLTRHGTKKGAWYERRA